MSFRNMGFTETPAKPGAITPEIQQTDPLPRPSIMEAPRLPSVSTELREIIGNGELASVEDSPPEVGPIPGYLIPGASIPAPMQEIAAPQLSVISALKGGIGKLFDFATKPLESGRSYRVVLLKRPDMKKLEAMIGKRYSVAGVKLEVFDAGPFGDTAYFSFKVWRE